MLCQYLAAGPDPSLIWYCRFTLEKSLIRLLFLIANRWNSRLIHYHWIGFLIREWLITAQQQITSGLWAMERTSRKVHIYLEYHSVCPLVRIGTPPHPHPLASVSPRNQGVRGWGSPNSDDWRKSLALFLLCGTSAQPSVSLSLLRSISFKIPASV
jgi:hypothetical protein